MLSSNYPLLHLLLASSERLYCVHPAAEERAQGLTLASPRGLSPPSTRILRVIMHLAMAAGVAGAPSSSSSSDAPRYAGRADEKAPLPAPANRGVLWGAKEGVGVTAEHWCEEVMRGVFNSSFAAPAQYSQFPAFLSDHVEQDWGLLQTLSSLQEDEVGLLLHGVLGSLVTDLSGALGFSGDSIVGFESSISSCTIAPFSFTAALAHQPAAPSLPELVPGQSQSEGLEKSFALLPLSSDRVFWESFVDKVHIFPWITPSAALGAVGAGGGCTLSNHLGIITAAWRLEDEKENKGDSTSCSAGGGSASHFTVQLLERDTHSSPLLQPTLPPSLPASSSLLADRQTLLPTLWRLPRVFCFDEFVSSLNMLDATNTNTTSSTSSNSGGGDAKQQYPILSSFMSMFAADAGQLHALRFLPQVFEWFHRLRRLYSGHVTREDARQRTHLDCLRDLATSDPSGHWAGVFEGYSLAWNASWGNVQKFGCIQFSSDFKAIQMGPDVPLTFSLPNAMDEGNCPLALTHFLVEKQNTFAQLLDEYFLLQQLRGGSSGGAKARGGGREGSSARRVGVVSSRFLTPAHTIRCDLHADLIPLLEKHCLLRPSSSGTGVVGEGKYDFAKAERLLVERFLLDVPAVDLEMPGFTFKHEQHLQGT